VHGLMMNLYANRWYAGKPPGRGGFALKLWIRRLAVVCVLLWWAFPSFGQKAAPKTGNEQVAVLRGTITATQDGSALVGATVKLSQTPPSGTPLAVETDKNGNYAFLALAPGPYSISITGEGFKAITMQIVLSRGEQKIQNFSMNLAGVAQRVEVSGSASAITTESSSAPNAFVTTTELITLPTAQEKVKKVLPVTPGVVQTLDSKLVFKGSDENQSLLIVNSARNTDPVTGSFGITVPTDAVESFAVYKTPYDASLGSFSGGLTTIETKPPADNWDFHLRGLGISIQGKNGHMVGFATAGPAISFDIPLVPHKLLLSEAFQYDMKKTVVEGLPWPNDISKRQGFNSFTTIEAILATNHVLTLTVTAFPLRTEHIDISALVPQPASNNLNQSGATVGLSDRYEFDSGAVLTTGAQYTRFDSFIQPCRAMHEKQPEKVLQDMFKMMKKCVRKKKSLHTRPTPAIVAVKLRARCFKLTYSLA
jgi:Carboxypeptidase regulatory-like domain